MYAMSLSRTLFNSDVPRADKFRQIQHLCLDSYDEMFTEEIYRDNKIRYHAHSLRHHAIPSHWHHCDLRHPYKFASCS